MPEFEGPTGKKIKSNAQDFSKLEWRRDTGNPYIDNAEISERDVGGRLKIGDNYYEVRMPMRKLVKKFDWIKERYDPESDTIEVDNTKETLQQSLSLEDVQDQILEDMLVGFDIDNPGVRMDDIVYNQIVKFCWTFYHFFVLKSRGQQKGVSLSVEG